MNTTASPSFMRAGAAPGGDDRGRLHELVGLAARVGRPQAVDRAGGLEFRLRRR